MALDSWFASDALSKTLRGRSVENGYARTPTESEGFGEPAIHEQQCSEVGRSAVDISQGSPERVLTWLRHRG
jgi:hypothetical protein